MTGAHGQVLMAADELATGAVSYGDLVALALPSTVVEGKSIVLEQDLALPHIEGPDFVVTAIAPVEIDTVIATDVVIDGAPHLALTIGLGETQDGLGPVTGLALFDMSGEPKLVDVVDVGFDRMTGFVVPPTLRVGSGDDLILISNRHGNAGQFYDATTLVDVIEGKLTLVDMVMTLSTLVCEGSSTQSVTYEASAPEGGGKGPFRISVKDVEAPPDQPCEGAQSYAANETIYAVDYIWDAAAGRYVASGDGWAALDEVNSERY